MGICSSCLSTNRHAQNHSNDETDPLITDGQTRYGTGSGDRGSNAGSERGRAPRDPDPEVLRREREEMERICARLAGKLIDVTAPSQPNSEHARAEDTGEHSAEPSRPRVDYSQLLRATFEDQTYPSKVPPRLANSADTQKPLKTVETGDDTIEVNRQGHEGLKDEELLKAQKLWLKNIMRADLVERRWDWNRVKPIEGRLTFSFDDF